MGPLVGAAEWAPVAAGEWSLAWTAGSDATASAADAVGSCSGPDERVD